MKPSDIERICMTNVHDRGSNSLPRMPYANSPVPMFISTSPRPQKNANKNSLSKSESVLETGTCTVFVPPHCASESRSRNSPEDEAEDQSAQSSQPPPLSRMRVKDADPANRMMGVMTKLT